MTPPTKILYVSHTAGLSGAEVCLYNLVKYLDRERYDPVVVFPAEGPLKEKIDALGITNYISPLDWWVEGEGSYIFSGYPQEERIEKLCNIIAQEKPTLVQTNTSVVVDGALAAARMKLPHIWHIHEILDGLPNVTPILPYPLFYKTIEELSQGVVVVSNEAKRELSKYLSPQKMTTIHNGIVLNSPSTPSIPSIRAELSLPESAIIALTVSTLCQCKGQDNLVRAAPAVIGQNPDIHFVHAGHYNKNDLQKAVDLAVELGVEQNIHYLGYRNDIPALLAQSNLFVLPSIREAFPLVVLEAMAAAKAVVATNCCGPAEMVEEGASGFIVPINDPTALAARILDATEDRVKLAEMGLQGRNLFEQKFTVERYARAFADFYVKALESPAPSQEHVWADAYVEMNEKFAKAMREILQLGEVQQKLSDTRATLEALYNSASWRITAPLRWAASLPHRKKH